MCCLAECSAAKVCFTTIVLASDGAGYFIVIKENSNTNAADQCRVLSMQSICQVVRDNVT